MLFTTPISSFLIDFFAPRLLIIEEDPKRVHQINATIIEGFPSLNASSIRAAVSKSMGDDSENTRVH